MTSNLAMGRVMAHRLFSATITRPTLFGTYLAEQLARIRERNGGTIMVGLSRCPTPLSFAIEHAEGQADPVVMDKIRSAFYTPNLLAINDDIVDGGQILNVSGAMRLSLFTTERSDCSLHRIKHYTATDPEYFQSFMPYTNYQRYVDEFILNGTGAVEQGGADALVAPGNKITSQGETPPKPPPERLPKMPAYHLLVRPNRTGVTLVNIGVDPSNA